VELEKMDSLAGVAVEVLWELQMVVLERVAVDLVGDVQRELTLQQIQDRAVAGVDLTQQIQITQVAMVVQAIADWYGCNNGSLCRN
jgi:hypothetical protein